MIQILKEQLILMTKLKNQWKIKTKRNRNIVKNKKVRKILNNKKEIHINMKLINNIKNKKYQKTQH